MLFFMLKKIFDGISNTFTGLINKIFEKKRWDLYLYYNGIMIKRVKIRNGEDIKVMSINIVGHKELFGKSKINAVIRPVKLLLTEEDKKKTYWGVIFEKGVDVDGR